MTVHVTPATDDSTPALNAAANAGVCICANVCPVLTVCVANTTMGVGATGIAAGDDVGAAMTPAAAAKPDRYAPCTVAGYSADVCSPAKNKRPLTEAARLLRSLGCTAPTLEYEYDPRLYGSLFQRVMTYLEYGTNVVGYSFFKTYVALAKMAASVHFSNLAPNDPALNMSNTGWLV